MIRLWGGYLRYGFCLGLSNALILIFSTSLALAETKTVIAFGDSLTQGFGLPVDQGFVPQLENWLADNGVDVLVVNAGVSGDTSAGGAARIDWTLVEPADAIVINLGSNDLLRGIDPRSTRANLTAIVAASRAKGLDILLVGSFAPFNYGPDYKETYDAIFPELAEEFETPLYATFFAAFGASATDFPDLTGVVQSDGLHPNVEGVRRVVADMGPIVLDLLTN